MKNTIEKALQKQKELFFVSYVSWEKSFLIERYMAIIEETLI